MTTCPLTQTSGRPCTNHADPDSFFDICTDHWEQIVNDHKRLTAEPHRLANIDCPICKRSNLVGPGVPLACTNPRCWEEAWWNQPSADEGIPTAKGTSWVYYLRFGNRIKIGTSTNLKGRLATLPYDEILALEPGDVTLERRRHHQFFPMLVAGQREWFHESRELLSLVRLLRIQHGTPEQIMRAA